MKVRRCHLTRFNNRISHECRMPRHEYYLSDQECEFIRMVEKGKSSNATTTKSGAVCFRGVAEWYKHVRRRDRTQFDMFPTCLRRHIVERRGSYLKLLRGMTFQQDNSWIKSGN